MGSSFGVRVSIEMRGKEEKEEEAPIVRLIIASLREIPTDLIVIAKRGTGLGAVESKRFGVQGFGLRI